MSLERRGNLISTTAAAGEIVPPGGSGGQTQTPYYDDIVIQRSDQELELKVININHIIFIHCMITMNVIIINK